MSTKLAVFTTPIVWVIPSCAYTWFPGILLYRFPCLKSLCTLVTSGSIIFLFADIWFNSCSKLLNTAKQKVAIQLYMAFLYISCIPDLSYTTLNTIVCKKRLFYDFCMPIIYQNLYLPNCILHLAFSSDKYQTHTNHSDVYQFYTVPRKYWFVSDDVDSHFNWKIA